MADKKIVVVVFKALCSPYNGGESAGFDAEKAAELVASGIAYYADDPPEPSLEGVTPADKLRAVLDATIEPDKAEAKAPDKKKGARKGAK